MKGILTLAELIADQLDDDADFSSTVYNGPPIIRAEFIGFGRTMRLRTEEHPNLFRKLINMQYLRVRESGWKVEHRNFVMAMREKILSKAALRDQFVDQLIFADDESEPSFPEGISMSRPILGIHDSEFITRMRTGGQREERINIELWLFMQRFGKNVAETITGD